MAQILDDSNFVTIIGSSELPVVVDFWAPWCGPCRMVSPIIDEMSEKYAGKVNICKCDVDECSDAPMKYGIRNIPTILFFKNGQLVDRVVGAVPRNEIENKINSLL